MSGKARQTVPRAVRWSLPTLFSSPPTYWPGVSDARQDPRDDEVLQFLVQHGFHPQRVHPPPTQSQADRDSSSRRLIQSALNREWNDPSARYFHVSYTVTGFLNSCAKRRCPVTFHKTDMRIATANNGRPSAIRYNLLNSKSISRLHLDPNQHEHDETLPWTPPPSPLTPDPLPTRGEGDRLSQCNSQLESRGWVKEVKRSPSPRAGRGLG